MKKILITVHRGLIGRHLLPLLLKAGYQVIGLDTSDFSGDITRREGVQSALAGVQGVIHLAAVSRVLLGERNPEMCWQTNAMASHSILTEASNCSAQLWVSVICNPVVQIAAFKQPVYCAQFPAVFQG